VYGDDVDIVMLTGQMEILKVLLKDGDFLCFDDIILKIKASAYTRTEHDKRDHHDMQAYTSKSSNKCSW